MSSFSPDLRIELIATGDQAGVWGDTTNVNLGTLLENAIAGYTSVAISATPQALTANDGAADEARFALVALTTSTGAAFTVCIPPCSKAYVFYNTSSYTATISNSTTANGTTLSGGATVDIPAGKAMALWSDGTNVYSQNTYTTATTDTQAAKTSNTTIASTAFVDRLRSLLNSSAVSGTPTTAERGCLIAATSTVNIPANVFAVDDVFTIANNTSGNISITQGSGLTMYLVGTATTGTRTLAQRGLATVVFLSATVCIISGGGLS